MTHIGTTRSSVAYLIEVLVEIISELDDQLSGQGPREKAAHEARVRKLTVPTAPLPNFSAFHDAFRYRTEPQTPEGDMRRAFFTAYNEDLCEYLSPVEVSRRLADGNLVVSATFVTPYPPGFPVLVPGQRFSSEIMEFMASLDTPEIHGYRPELGYRVFTEKAIHQIGTLDAAESTSGRTRHRLRPEAPSANARPPITPADREGTGSTTTRPDHTAPLVGERGVDPAP
jgi:arginine decarboxylase